MKSSASWRNSGWTELPFFLAVARSGSLRTAAASLKVNHSTVDRHIRELEASYHVRLFDRSAKGLSLTQAGDALLEKAEKAEQAVFAGRRSVQGLDDVVAGKVHLTTNAWVAYFIVAPALPKLAELHPGIELKLTVTDALQDLSKTEPDVSIRSAWSVEDDVTGRKVYTYSVGVLASKDYLASNWDSRGPNGEGLHWAGPSILYPNPKWDKVNPFPKAAKGPETSDPVVVHELLRQGQGMCVVPLDTMLVYPDLTLVPESPILADRSVWLLLHSDLKKTAKVRAVVDFLSDTLQRFNARSKSHTRGDFRL